jgi:alkanesulfonate monooxygenase SsuD/methylene tetrahydromethanopterin reductase-like flavin-dependent oxidoreductase (luciferase family)
MAAQYAAEYNMPFLPLNLLPGRVAAVREACEKRGRDPSSIVLSAAMVVCVGADEAAFVRRAEAIGRAPDQLRAAGVSGTPQEAIDFLGRLADAGITRTYLQFLDLSDHEHFRLVAAEVAGKI